MRMTYRKPWRRGNPPSSAGFALVFALGIVVLVAGLTLAFLLSSRTERVVAGGFSASAAARHLSHIAVNLVQAQINHATTRDEPTAWTSQPGMIRTFDVLGGLSHAYKLYSADKMVDTSIDFAADLPPDGWNRSPAVWVDLNAPMTAGGLRHFPILDPSALEDLGTIAGLSSSKAGGLHIGSPPGATGYQPIPMPVRWLYLLKDGRVVAPTGSDNEATVPGESAANPIVGRLAFWTDDDTCKVNVNTAGGGVGTTDTYWDVPRASSVSEADLGRFQPAQREYQRYPGHPGTVALSAVLPGLSLAQYMQLTPRYRHGGSEGGTQVPPPGGVMPKTERLYASVDEMMFLAPPALVPTSYDTRTAVEVLTDRVLRSRDFLMTAHSRAPEINLFGMPRIAIWPIFNQSSPDHPKRTTAYDRLISFCSSLRTTEDLQPYFFQRERNRNDLRHDIGLDRNLKLYSYLQYQTGNEIPGYGGSFLGKYPADRDQILTEIFDYIRCTNLYDDNLPSGSQFTETFRDFSFDRNGNRTTESHGHGFVTPSRHLNGTQGFGRFLTLSELGILFICNADPGHAASNDTTKNKHLDGVALQPGQRRIQAMILPELSGVSQGWTVQRPLLTVRIEGLSGLKVATDQGETPLALQDGDLAFGDRLQWNYNFGNAAMTGDSIGVRALLYQKRAPNGVDPATGSPIYPFVGAPVTLRMPSTGNLMRFSGGTLIVKIYSGPTASAPHLVQTFDINLPAAEFPIPELVTTPLDAVSVEDWWSLSMFGIDEIANGTVPPAGRMALAFNDPGSAASGWKKGCLIRPEFDVLRTVLPKHGDLRLIAARPRVTADVFQPHRYYRDTTRRLASNLTSPQNRLSFPGFDFGGTYASNVSFASNGAAPDVAADAPLTPHTSGDFDNGISNAPDGPFINKPDEGNSGTTSLIGYYQSVSATSVGGAMYFSPNRIMPSPGMLGSLPTGVQSNTPWQTLLLRPQPSHPQSRQSRTAQPPDHLLMDLFWMPVVEPYALSDRMSTAGKINMNYQIVPFTYIDRSAGMRAVLKTEKVAAIANAQAGNYKEPDPRLVNNQYRYDLDVEETLSQFSSKFNQGGVFISPSEICDIYMVPKGTALDGIEGFWDKHRLTGDNTREHIYTTLYPKLTTRSNTYTVHFRAQALKKSARSQPGTWIEGQDAVLGEYRGSTTIERFINPEADMPDYAANPSVQPKMDAYYKWRVVENRQFAP